MEKENEPSVEHRLRMRPCSKPMIYCSEVFVDPPTETWLGSDVCNEWAHQVLHVFYVSMGQTQDMESGQTRVRASGRDVHFFN